MFYTYPVVIYLPIGVLFILLQRYFTSWRTSLTFFFFAARSDANTFLFVYKKCPHLCFERFFFFQYCKDFAPHSAAFYFLMRTVLPFLFVPSYIMGLPPSVCFKDFLFSLVLSSLSMMCPGVGFFTSMLLTFFWDTVKGHLKIFRILLLRCVR